MDDEFLADDDAAEPRHPLRRPLSRCSCSSSRVRLSCGRSGPVPRLLFTRSIFRAAKVPTVSRGLLATSYPSWSLALQRSDAGPVEQASAGAWASRELEQLRAIVVPYSKSGLASVEVGGPSTAADGTGELSRVRLGFEHLRCYAISVRVRTCWHEVVLAGDRGRRRARPAWQCWKRRENGVAGG